MLPIRSHARTRLLQLSPGGGCAFACQRRGFLSAPAQLKDGLLVAKYPMAKALQKTNVWTLSKDRKKKKAIAPADRTRINIVSDQLCDDIFAYLGDLADRHKGCDLVDLYPGAGVWSRKLHTLLKPRSHIMMEPDEELYRPFLADLLAKPGARLVPKSGIVWSDLTDVLSPEFLPHQKVRPWAPDIPPERNDTLLVTMNLASYPRRRFLTFESMASLVLFQLLSSMRAGSLFQKYGLVRLLIWTAAEDAARLLPRVVQLRNRAAIDAELNTEWTREVVSFSDPDAGRFSRDTAIDLEGGARVLAQMRANGTVTIPGRETHLLRQVLEMGDDVSTAGAQQAEWRFNDEQELSELEAAFEAGKIETGSAKMTRFKNLQYYSKWQKNRSGLVFGTEEERMAVVDLYRAGDPTAPAAEAAWLETLEGQNRKLREQYQLYRDNMHVFRQDPPVLMWDRRPYEPLQVRPDEFYPNVPLTLMDIQPRATHPLLRDMGPDSTHAGDFFELIMRTLQQSGSMGVTRALDTIAPGCSDAVVPACPSLRDPDLCGSPIGGYGEVACRTLNERQMMEILQGWMDWPLKPSYSRLVGRLTDSEEAETEDD